MLVSKRWFEFGSSFVRTSNSPTPFNLNRTPFFGFGKRGLLDKGSFQKSPFSRDSRKFRGSRGSREYPDSGKQRRIRPFSRDSREFRDFRDSRDSSSEKTPFAMTPFSGPDFFTSVLPSFSLTVWRWDFKSQCLRRGRGVTAPLKTSQRSSEIFKSGVTPANQTKERRVHELFAGAFRNKSSTCESCLFS